MFIVYAIHFNTSFFNIQDDEDLRKNMLHYNDPQLARQIRFTESLPGNYLCSILNSRDFINSLFQSI